MSPISKVRFEDWEAERLQDEQFVREVGRLEAGHQVACLRIERGLTQAQLAELVGTKQPSIARLERGERMPSVAFLEKVADALGARVEVRIRRLEEKG